MGKLTRLAVEEELKRLGVDYDPAAKYNDLVALLSSHRPASAPAPSPEASPEAPQEERLKPDAQKEPQDEPQVEERLVPPAPAAPSESNVDYLRQYQFRKQTAPGSKGSDPIPGSKAERMKNVLLTQPKVKIFVPREKGEDPSIKLSVTLNGYRLDYPKQTYLDVPMQVAEVVMESLEQTEKALLHNQISGSQSKENALL